MKKLLFMLMALGFTATLSAQRINIKNNLLGDATLSPNLALELGLGKKTTFDLYGSYNPFEFKDKDNAVNDIRKFKHWLVQPEFRFWTCERFNGTFIGIHAHGGEFNVTNIAGIKFLKERRYEGWLAGGGVTLGHQWILGKRWSLEAALGAGYAYIDYDKFECGECGNRLKSGDYHYFGITRTVVSFCYFFR